MSRGTKRFFSLFVPFSAHAATDSSSAHPSATRRPQSTSSLFRHSTHSFSAPPCSPSLFFPPSLPCSPLPAISPNSFRSTFSSLNVFLCLLPFVFVVSGKIISPVSINLPAFHQSWINILENLPRWTNCSLFVLGFGVETKFPACSSPLCAAKSPYTWPHGYIIRTSTPAFNATSSLLGARSSSFIHQAFVLAALPLPSQPPHHHHHSGSLC